MRLLMANTLFRCDAGTRTPRERKCVWCGRPVGRLRGLSSPFVISRYLLLLFRQGFRQGSRKGTALSIHVTVTDYLAAGRVALEARRPGPENGCSGNRNDSPASTWRCRQWIDGMPGFLIHADCCQGGWRRQRIAREQGGQASEGRPFRIGSEESGRPLRAGRISGLLREPWRRVG